jgi:hypothetical protein
MLRAKEIFPRAILGTRARSCHPWSITHFQLLEDGFRTRNCCSVVRHKQQTVPASSPTQKHSPLAVCVYVALSSLHRLINYVYSRSCVVQCLFDEQV